MPWCSLLRLTKELAGVTWLLPPYPTSIIEGECDINLGSLFLRTVSSVPIANSPLTGRKILWLTPAYMLSLLRIDGLNLRAGPKLIRWAPALVTAEVCISYIETGLRFSSSISSSSSFMLSSKRSTANSRMLCREAYELRLGFCIGNSTSMASSFRNSSFELAHALGCIAVPSPLLLT